MSDPVPVTVPPTVPPTPSRSSSRTGRTTIVASVALLVVVLGLVLAMGMLTDATETNPGSIPPSGGTVPQDPLSGALILPITSVSGIETHCGGRNACWVWRIVDTTSCSGTVEVDFFAHAHDAVPAEADTEQVVIHANQPAYVAVPSSEFTEPYARITQYDCD